MASTIQVDKVQDTGGNTILSSNSTGTFTYEAASGANFTALDADNVSAGTLAIARGGTGAATLAAAGLSVGPAFHAYLPGDQSPGDATWAVLSASTELYDSDGCYNTSDYKFTPTTAGKYFIYGQMHMDDASGDNMVLWAMGFKKNTSYVTITQMDGRGTAIGDAFTFSAATVVDMNGSSDYVQLWGYYDGLSGSPRFMGGAERCFLGGYRLIGA